MLNSFIVCVNRSNVLLPAVNREPSESVVMLCLYLGHFGGIRRFRLKVGVVHDEGEHLMGCRSLWVRIGVFGSGGAAFLLGLLPWQQLCCRSESEGDGLWSFGCHLEFRDVDHRPETGGNEYCNLFTFSISLIVHVVH